MCNVRWALVFATFPTKGYPTNVNAEGRQQLKALGNSLRHRPWLVLISNCRHEQQACAFTAALNIEQPCGVTRKKRGAPRKPGVHCYITNTQLGKHSNFCTRATFSLSLDIPRLLRWPPRRCSARPSTTPSKDTWGMCNVRCVLVLATFPTEGFPTNVNAEGMQQLKAFGRTTQSCFVSRSKGILKSFCDLLPRTCPSSVSISRCSVRKGQRLCCVRRLQSELAVDL